MPFDEKLRDRVRLALAGTSKMKEKKYFNGAVFMVDGKTVHKHQEESDHAPGRPGDS